MAKGERRSNREVRKPKKTAAQRMASAPQATIPDVMSRAEKGRRKPKR